MVTTKHRKASVSRTASSAVASRENLNFKAEFTQLNKHLKFKFSPEDAMLMAVPFQVAEQLQKVIAIILT